MARVLLSCVSLGPTCLCMLATTLAGPSGLCEDPPPSPPSPRYFCTRLWSCLSTALAFLSCSGPSLRCSLCRKQLEGEPQAPWPWGVCLEAGGVVTAGACDCVSRTARPRGATGSQGKLGPGLPDLSALLPLFPCELLERVGEAGEGTGPGRPPPVRKDRKPSELTEPLTKREKPSSSCPILVCHADRRGGGGLFASGLTLTPAPAGGGPRWSGFGPPPAMGCEARPWGVDPFRLASVRTLISTRAAQRDTPSGSVQVSSQQLETGVSRTGAEGLGCGAHVSVAGPGLEGTLQSLSCLLGCF